MVLVSQAACSSLNEVDFPGVYKMDIQQGNVIEQDKVKLLQVGLTRDQVRYVMGSPLVVGTFNDDYWDYVYQLIQGDGRATHKRVRVLFKDDFVAAIQ